MFSKVLSKSYFVSLLLIVSYKEFVKCKDDLKFWERDPKFWTRDENSMPTNRVKLLAHSEEMPGRRHEPGVEYLKIPYSRDGDNLFAGDYKTADIKSMKDSKPRQETEFVRQRSGKDNKELVARANYREEYGRDRDRNRDIPSKNKKVYERNEHNRYNEQGRNRDYYDDKALDMPGRGQDIDYGSPTRNKKDSRGENNKQTRGTSIRQKPIEDDRNRDRGRPKNDNIEDKYFFDYGRPFSDKQDARIGRGKPMAKDRFRLGRVTKTRYDSKEDDRHGRGKQMKSKEYFRPAGHGRVTVGQQETWPSDHERLNKDGIHKSGRGGRVDDMDQKREPDDGRPIKDTGGGSGRSGRIDDIEENRKPGYGRLIKDTNDRPGRSERIDDIEERRKPDHGRSIKGTENRPGRSGRIDDINEKRKPGYGRPTKNRDDGPGISGRIDDRDEKRYEKRGHGRPIKDTDELPGRGGRIEDIDEKRKPGRSRPTPGIERIHNGRPYTYMGEKRTTSHGRPFAGSHGKDGPGRGGMISDMEDRREPGHGKQVVDIDEGRGPSRNKPIHKKGGGESGRNRPTDKEIGHIKRGFIKKIARDPTYNEEKKGSVDSKHKTTKKHGHVHHDIKVTAKAKHKKEKHHSRFTTGMQDYQIAHDYATETEDSEAESQEVDKHKFKDSILRNSENKKGKSAVQIKPLGPNDLPNLSPHSIARQLICIAKRNNNASIVQENIGRTTEYRDIIMWKMKEKKYFRSGAHFRASDDKKYADEGPEKKIIFIVHGLSVMGWNKLPCLRQTKQFETLVSYYVENLDSFDIFLIPMANPDGVAAIQQKSYWNKNMSPQKACPGVALDRNFDVAWNVSRSVNSCNGQYPGPTPFSELETQAIREVFHHYGHKIVGYFHVHSGTFEGSSFKGDAVLYPKGYTESQSDDDKYIDLRGEIDEALRNASFKVLSVTVDTLYNWYGLVAGTSVDYASSVYGIPYALELVMQLYDNNVMNPPDKREQNLALTEVWQMVLDVIFDHIYRTTVKNNEND